jgi:hypothetical protein
MINSASFSIKEKVAEGRMGGIKKSEPILYRIGSLEIFSRIYSKYD